jgi:hypothetical protein
MIIMKMLILMMKMLMRKMEMMMVMIKMMMVIIYMMMVMIYMMMLMMKMIMVIMKILMLMIKMMMLVIRMIRLTKKMKININCLSKRREDNTRNCAQFHKQCTDSPREITNLKHFVNTPIIIKLNNIEIETTQTLFIISEQNDTQWGFNI